MAKTLNCGLVLVGPGYCDFYRKQNRTKSIRTFYYDTPGASAYDYNESTGEFVAAIGVTGAYSVGAAVTFPIQDSSEVYEASFESVNIVFNKETVDANALQMFLQASNGISSIRISWATDSNFVFQSAQAERKLHEAIEETSSWANSTIYYKGKKQLFVKEIKPSARVGRSIKFRVDAVLNVDTLDEIKIHHIEVLPTGLLFVSDNNA